jgi:hypothetical protein
MSRALPLVLAVVVPLGIACTEPSAPAAATRTTPGPSFDLVTIEIDREVTAEEFALADKDQTGGICVKGTSSDNLLMMDANAATPSEPCPPAWQFVGKPMGIKIRKEWYTEDKNANGLVCVKFVTDTKTIVKDDNAGTPSQPCPPAFYAVGKTPSGPKVDADDLKTADGDGDGLICVNALGSGNFLARDDNDATPSQPCPPSWFLFGSNGADPGAEPAEPGKD